MGRCSGWRDGPPGGSTTPDTIGNLPLIHNPAAGSGHSTACLVQGKALLRARGIETCTLATTGPGHATELALEVATQGARTILLMGGDGTVSEVANGIVHLPKEERPVLGTFPGGTGNDFLRDFGIFDLKRAAEAIASARTTA